MQSGAISLQTNKKSPNWSGKKKDNRQFSSLSQSRVVLVQQTLGRTAGRFVLVVSTGTVSKDHETFSLISPRPCFSVTLSPSRAALWSRHAYHRYLTLALLLLLLSETERDLERSWRISTLEFVYLLVTRMLGESYHRRFRSLNLLFCALSVERFLFPFVYRVFVFISLFSCLLLRLVFLSSTTTVTNKSVWWTKKKKTK